MNCIGWLAGRMMRIFMRITITVICLVAAAAAIATTLTYKTLRTNSSERYWELFKLYERVQNDLFGNIATVRHMQTLAPLSVGRSVHC